MADTITCIRILKVQGINVFSIFIPTSTTAGARQHQKQPKKSGNSPCPISPFFLVPAPSWTAPCPAPSGNSPLACFGLGAPPSASNGMEFHPDSQGPVQPKHI